ncbi:MAG: hypothetical protein PUH08_06560 [Treponema sp.]|nr:hypothetical protein [Treponema sp.]MDY3754464.1 hypothetical protein [Treponema sp.]MDY4674871.1 hypothetical protein [Treponema sp.]
MPNVDQIAQEADIIVNGFAFKKNENEIKVFDLNNEVGAAVFNSQCELIETNMNDIELAIAHKYLINNIALLEV